MKNCLIYLILCYPYCQFDVFFITKKLSVFGKIGVMSISAESKEYAMIVASFNLKLPFNILSNGLSTSNRFDCYLINHQYRNLSLHSNGD